MWNVDCSIIGASANANLTHWTSKTKKKLIRKKTLITLFLSFKIFQTDQENIRKIMQKRKQKKTLRNIRTDIRNMKSQLAIFKCH
jgi:hypothetical protein